MPEMSGFDVLDRLKEDPVTMDIPVVVLTSRTSPTRSAAARPARPTDRLQAGAAAGARRHLRDILSDAGLEGGGAWLRRGGVILNVDDYEASRYARSQMLRRAGFQVLEAAPARRRSASRRGADRTSCSSTSTCRT